ncbi:MAG: ATP-binding cassette domain-containing protein [Kofleriaceae bacterium]|nr:ATP-binding cassette domain-containing protein [Kofleriaceae bacterium]
MTAAGHDPAAAASLITGAVTKRYDGRTVLDAATLQVRAGAIHALVGENGAGKSTLVKIVAGLVRPDAGAIAVAPGQRVGLVPQHGALVPTLTVVENAVLGREPGRAGVLALAPVADALRALGAAHGLAVDPWARAGALSVGEQQRAEIVIALWRGASLLILDEPTAVLAPVEVDGLFAVLRGVAAAGGAVVLVTHKLDEVVAIADDLTVLRAGRVVRHDVGVAGHLDATTIARAMVGGEPPPRATAPPPPAATAAIALAVRGLHVADATGAGVHGVDLALRAGELVGVAGVEGNGQRALVEAIAGLRRPGAGRIELGGVDVTGATVAARLAAGLGHVAEDRHAMGLVLDASIEDNVALGREAELGAGLGGWILGRRARRALADAIVRDLDVRPPDPTLPARALSGGNQQKIVVGRELTRPALRALVAAQPTRGVDLGAQALIHARLRDAAGRGVAVLLVSADLDELLGLCHRVVVLHRGRLVGEVVGDALRADGVRGRLGALMTGAAAAEEAA